jgi:hypothetical protein
VSKKRGQREPLVEALAIGITDKQLAVSLLTNLELARARIDAFDFSIHEEGRRNNYSDRQFSDAVGIVKLQLYKAMHFAMEQVLSFATINEDVRKEVNKNRIDKIKEEASVLHSLAEVNFWDLKETDIKKLIAIKLGYNPAELGIKDEEE